MTNEELNTALYKKVFAEAFVKERNEALFSLDRKKIEAYMIKYGETEIAQTPDVVFWASVYKAICGIKDAPEAIVNDAYGDEAACIIVDERGKLVLDDVYNGFDDDTLRLLDLEVKEVPEMPDPTLSVQDMKDYGYAWAGVLPAGQEAAEKALEKGCEVYRLYSDNTEGLCVDAKEIADHAAKGGMLGISKESWMAALEKENYLKTAEMSMEDDYGMIDGIINNGPKEDKTAEVKAPERGEKSSIMDRLKSAKAEKQKECCPPQKHKGEIEL